MLACLVACALAAEPAVEVTALAAPITNEADSFDVAIRLQLPEPWHVYWHNPGDSGLPIAVKWELPDGATAGALTWPAPQRFRDDPIATYGYHHEAILTARIFGVNDPATIAATVSWLACDEACVPGKRRVIAAPDEQARAVINASRAQVPTSATADELAITSVNRDGEFLVIATSGSLAALQSDVYPEAVKGLIIQHGGIIVKPGSIRIPLRGTAASLPIVVRCGERAVRINVTLPQ